MLRNTCIAMLACFLSLTATEAKSQGSGGYDQPIVNTDGPIVYGTNLSLEDRKKAWRYFWLLMVQTSIKQQGENAVGLKLARRCAPSENVCMVTVDANLIGIGGIPEPRKVAIFIATDAQDKDKQLARMVCTWPEPHERFCRDWDTGELLPNYEPSIK